MQERSEERRKTGDTWKPVDLRAVLNAGYEPPRPEVCAVEGSEFGLFYPGRINSVFGDSGGGKSWLLAYSIGEQISQRKFAVLIDYEDHPAAFVSRLVQLGVEEELIFKYLAYFNPQEKWSPSAEKVLTETLGSRTITIAVLDSTGEGMAADGVNPNSDDEVARWFRGAARYFSDRGAATVLVDHVVKSMEYGRNKDFASGSQRKRAAITGAAYFLDVVSAPSRENDGMLKLVTKKDRSGWRKHGSVACEIHMVNRDDNSIDMQVKMPSGPALSAAGTTRRTWYMEQVSLAVELNDGVNMSGLIKQVREVKHGASDKYVRDAARVLAEEGWLAETDHGVGKSKTFRLVKPYRQVNDPKSTDFVDKGTELADPGYF